MLSTQSVDPLTCVPFVPRAAPPRPPRRIPRQLCFIFVYSSPFTLVECFGWSTPAVTAVVVFMYYGLLEVASALADPFGHKGTDFDLVFYGLELHDELLCVARRVDPHARPFTGAGVLDPKLREPIGG